MCLGFSIRVQFNQDLSDPTQNNIIYFLIIDDDRYCVSRAYYMHESAFSNCDEMERNWVKVLQYVFKILYSRQGLVLLEDSGNE